MTQFDVAVVMPVYDRAWCVADAVHSVLDQKGPSIELIVVDDGSTDGTLELLQELAAGAAGRMRVLRHQGGANRGIAASRNLGLASARSPYIAFLDSDDRYHENRFPSALDALRRHPGCLAVVAPFVMIEGSGHRTLPHVCNLPIRQDGSIDALTAMLDQGLSWNTPVITLRREAFDVLGNFPEHLAVAEDTAMWLRLASTGRVGVAGESAVASVHRHGKHSWSQIDNEIAWRVYLDALLDVRAWVLNNRVQATADSITRIDRRLRSYLIETLERRQDSRRGRLAAWTAAIRGSPALAADRRVLANLARTVFG